MVTGVYIYMDSGEERGSRNAEEREERMGRRGRGRDGTYILLHTNSRRYFSQPKSGILENTSTGVHINVDPSSLGEE